MTYQDALFKNQIISGDRGCAERWEIIRQYVPQRGVILDVGSNLGYYGINAALLSEQVSVVSLEMDEQCVALQSSIVKSHNLDRVCIIQGALSGATANEWSKRGDWFDLTLLLSVLHWVDSPENVVKNLSRMSARMLVEVPDLEDGGACGQEKIKEMKDPRSWLEMVTGRKCTLLARCGRHTSAVPSHLILVEGPTDLNTMCSYWNLAARDACLNEKPIHFDGTSFRLNQDKTLPAISGANISSLMKIGRLVYPDFRYWITTAEEIVAAANHKSESIDIIDRKLLWSSTGMVSNSNGDSESFGSTKEQKLQLLSRCLRAWQNAETVDFDSRILAPRGSKMTRFVKRFMRGVLPAPMFIRLVRTRQKLLSK